MSDGEGLEVQSHTQLRASVHDKTFASDIGYFPMMLSHLFIPPEASSLGDMLTILITLLEFYD